MYGYVKIYLLHPSKYYDMYLNIIRDLFQLIKDTPELGLIEK